MPIATGIRIRHGRPMKVAAEEPGTEAEELPRGEHQIGDRVDQRLVDADDQCDRSATHAGDDFGNADECATDKVGGRGKHVDTLTAAGPDVSDHRW
jgi:hypothetical protein